MRRSVNARRWMAMSKLSVPARLTTISPRSIRSVQIAPLRWVIDPDLPILGDLAPSCRAPVRESNHSPRPKDFEMPRDLMIFRGFSRRGLGRNLLNRIGFSARAA